KIEGLSVVVDMPPVAAAGVRLAKFVLSIAACSIGALMLYLAIMELVIGSNLNAIFSPIVNQTQNGAAAETKRNIERLITDLTSGQNNDAWQMPADAQQNATQLIAALDRLPAATTSQKAHLRECVPLPDKDNGRAAKISECLSVLAALQPAMI